MNQQLVDRVKNLILQPKQEWEVIDGETYTVQELYTKYVMILAAIPAVAGFIGFSLIGLGGVLSSYRIPIASGLAHMVISYLFSLASVYLLALIVDALAPSFGAKKNFPQALKLVAFSMTPAWVAGVFLFLPAMSILALLGLYGFYLLFLGLPMLMGVMEEKAIPYFAVVVISAIVLYVVLQAITALTIPGPLRGF